MEELTAPLVTTDGSESLLIVAPTGQDGRLLTDFLSKEQIRCEVLPHVSALKDRTEKPFGAFLIAEEALDGKGIATLRRLLSDQEPWSDIPIILLTSGGETT